MFLKQSTAYTIKLGPFVDEDDGKTAETALTIAQASVRLSKNGGDMAQKNEATTCVHDELGYYNCTIDDTDTNTVGILKIMVHVSGALPVWQDLQILPANVYNSIVGGTDLLQVDTEQIADVAVSTSSAQLGVNLVNISGAVVSTSSAQIGANVIQISGDSDSANNLELDYDGTGYAKTNSTIGTCSSVTLCDQTTLVDTCTTNTDMLTTTDILDATVSEPTNLTTKNVKTILYSLFARFFLKNTQTGSEQKTFKVDGSTALATRTVSDDGSTQTLGAAS